MDDSMPTRRSGRIRKANKKYSVDAFEGLDILGTDSEPDAQAHGGDDSADDGEFAIENTAGAAGSLEADDLYSVERSGASDQSDIEIPAEESHSAMAVEGSTVLAKAVQRKPSRKPRRSGSPPIKALSNIQGVRSRGLPDPNHHGSRGILLSQLFGTDTEDTVYMARSRDKWASDPILPLRRANERGAGGMCHSFSHTEEQRSMEASVGWNWYYDHGGKDRLTKRQKTRHLSNEEGHTYLPHPPKSSQGFLMGHYGKQSLYALELGNVFNIKDAWGSIDDASEQADGGRTSRKGRKEGWIMNIGYKIQCLDWVPNRDGSIQLLAVLAVGSSPQPPRIFSQKAGVPLKAPAFTPAPPTLACIQIWAFSASTAAGQEGSLNSTQSPKLQMVICTDWGDVKHLKWCPIPRQMREIDGEGNVALGLLAGIWGDGRVKVLDLRIETDLDSPTKYVKLDSPAFDARPPKTLCTCLTWLSSSDLAVGCANGFVAIYSISHSPPENKPLSPTNSPLHPQSSSPSPPIPWFYQSVHAAYILTIASAYPSYPHFLITTSMDGYPRLTDLRAPTTDTVTSTRSRIGPAVLAWCDPVAGAIIAEENDYIRVYPLRRFFGSVSVARCEAAVLSLAVGTAHPFVLAGGADGAVVATNPMRKVLNQKLTQAQLCWFRHEWSRKGGGVVRFVEGFKVDNSKMLKGFEGAPRGKDGTTFAAIHEKEAGVTALAWNPNVVCGGWAAAGMGSGLVRVEDLAL